MIVWRQGDGSIVSLSSQSPGNTRGRFSHKGDTRGRFSSVKFKNGIIDFNNLNKQLKGKTNKTFTGNKAYKGNGYDKFVYIKGNFNSAYEYIRDVVKKMKYNVIKENCAWLCIEVLQQGRISKIQNTLLENLQYTKKYVRIRILWKYVTVYRKVANVIVPSKVHSQIYCIFNSNFYYC